MVLLLAMCSSPAISTAAPPTTITVWTHSAFTEEAPALKEATASFNRSQSAYKIDLYSSLNYRNFADWVHSTAVSGTLPCLLEIDGPFLAAFAWPGYLRPLDKFVSRQMRNDLLSSIIAQGTYDGHLYSLGLYESGLGLWANRRYLAAAHVRIPTVARPWTLAEFEQAMDKLARLDGVDYPLNLAVYTGTSEFFPYAYSPILQGFGGDLIDRSTYRSEGVLDGPQSVAAMTRFQYWFKRGWTRAVFDRNDDFEQGKTALSWTGHWKYIDYRKALGNDLILLPLPNFGHGIKTGMGSYSWGITRTCADPNGAWRFLSFLMSVKEILRLTNITGAPPARKSALAQSRLFGHQGPLRIFAEQLTIGAGVPRPVTPAYGTISKAFSEAVSVIIAGQDVQTALSRAAAAIDKGMVDNHGYPQ
ncbi:MAG: extracellular solute-binding protein [Pseudomonadota bacterium]|nr:extracellular solute-binding protein [Pseudomonadota bacterium]